MRLWIWGSFLVGSFVLSLFVEIVSKFILTQCTLKKTQSAAELYGISLKLCGSLRFPSELLCVNTFYFATSNYSNEKSS